MKRLVETKFSDEAESLIRNAEGECWTSNVKCPKCGSTTLTINEVTEVVGSYYQVDGVLEHTGYFEPGNITGISCVCGKCHHNWIPRNRCQLTNCEEIKITSRY